LSKPSAGPSLRGTSSRHRRGAGTSRSPATPPMGWSCCSARRKPGPPALVRARGGAGLPARPRMGSDRQHRGVLARHRPHRSRQFRRPGQTTPSRSCPGSGSSAGPSSAASSTSTSQPHRSPVQDVRWVLEPHNLELDRRGAELLFQVFTEREERASIAIASNAAFSKAHLFARTCARWQL